MCVSGNRRAQPPKEGLRSASRPPLARAGRSLPSPPPPLTVLIGRRWPTTPSGGGGQKAGVEGTVRGSGSVQTGANSRGCPVAVEESCRSKLVLKPRCRPPLPPSRRMRLRRPAPQGRQRCRRPCCDSEEAEPITLVLLMLPRRRWTVTSRSSASRVPYLAESQSPPGISPTWNARSVRDQVAVM